MFYKVHYPDGNIKKHKYDEWDRFWGKCKPSLDRVFYNLYKGTYAYYKISEMSEEEIWIEEISFETYSSSISTFEEVNKNFARFEISHNFELIEY